MSYPGHQGEALRKMQEAAWAANRGKPRAQHVKQRMREVRIQRSIAHGGRPSPYLDGVHTFQSHKEGRWYVWDPETRTRAPHARLVYEKYYGPLPKGYLVHHIDGDSLNDAPENLMAMTRRDHVTLHLYWSAVEHWLGMPISGARILEKFQEWRSSR